MTLYNCQSESLLTRNVRDCHKLGIPLLIDLDVVVLHPLPNRAHPLFVRMLQDVLAVLRMNCIQDVEEVLPITVLALRELVRHKLHELWIKTRFFPKV